jgi:hypothetical protein
VSRKEEIVSIIRTKSAEEVAEFMAEWMAEREKEQRRIGEFKEEIRDYVNRSKTLERELKEKAEAFEKDIGDFVMQLQGTMQMLHQGINRAEARINAQWNTMNAHIEFFKELALEKWDMVPKFFIERFMAVGARLFKEASEHQRAQHKRIIEDQKAGRQPAPIQPAPNPTVGAVLASELAAKADAFREEINELRQQAEGKDE